jgi:hypothetical protein
MALVFALVRTFVHAQSADKPIIEVFGFAAVAATF